MDICPVEPEEPVAPPVAGAAAGAAPDPAEGTVGTGTDETVGGTTPAGEEDVAALELKLPPAPAPAFPVGPDMVLARPVALKRRPLQGPAIKKGQLVRQQSSHATR